MNMDGLYTVKVHTSAKPSADVELTAENVSVSFDTDTNTFTLDLSDLAPLTRMDWMPVQLALCTPGRDSTFKLLHLHCDLAGDVQYGAYRCFDDLGNAWLRLAND